VLPSRRPPPLWRRVGQQLRDPLVLVLLAAAGFTRATVGVVQEVKAERAITALSALTAPDARVVRDGVQREVPAADLVVGDLLVLAEGEQSRSALSPGPRAVIAQMNPNDIPLAWPPAPVAPRSAVDRLLPPAAGASIETITAWHDPEPIGHSYR
jgi:hypothetical protein